MRSSSTLSPAKQALLEQRLQGVSATNARAPVIPVRTERDVAPLSFSQLQMWVLDQITPGNPAYNLPNGFRLKGALDVHALERSFNEIVRRHEILRTSFMVRAGEPFQRIHRELAIKVNVTLLDGLSGEAQERRLQELASEESVRRFDLTKLPLIHVSLFKLADAEHVLIINLHHLVCRLLLEKKKLDEIDAVYRAFTSGGVAKLPEPGVQYADCAQWQQRALADETAHRKQIEYWRAKLRGPLPVLELPCDMPRPPRQSFRGANVFFDIPAALAQELKTLGARADCTFFMTVLAAFQVLLLRYCGLEDLVIGTPFAARSPQEVEPLIGNFLNMAALRCDTSGDPSFIGLLRRVRDTVFEAFSNSDLPFEALIRHLKIDREPSRNPVFQALLQVLAVPAPKIGTLQVECFHFDLKYAQFDLSLHLYQQGAGYRGRFEYCTDLFRAESIQRLSSNFQQLLHAIVGDPQQNISQLPILAASERQQLLVEWNDTRSDYPADAQVHQLFERQAQRTPNRIAIKAGTRARTYAELDAQANRIAHVLRSRDAGSGQRIGL